MESALLSGTPRRAVVRLPDPCSTDRFAVHKILRHKRTARGVRSSQQQFLRRRHGVLRTIQDPFSRPSRHLFFLLHLTPVHVLKLISCPARSSSQLQRSAGTSCLLHFTRLQAEPTCNDHVSSSPPEALPYQEVQTDHQDQPMVVKQPDGLFMPLIAASSPTFSSSSAPLFRRPP